MLYILYAIQYYTIPYTNILLFDSRHILKYNIPISKLKYVCFINKINIKKVGKKTTFSKTTINRTITLGYLIPTNLNSFGP